MATLSVGGTTVFDGAVLQSGAVLTSATFPAGHVIQVYKNGDAFTATGLSAENSVATDADGAGETISNVTAGNILIATVTSSYAYYNYNGSSGYAMFRLGFSPNTGGDTFDDATAYYSRVHGNTPFYYQVIPVITCHYIIPSGVTSVEVLRRVESDNSSVTAHWATHNTGISKTKCVIMEVQG